MRKIDDTEMTKMLNEGKTQREVAHYFRVSEAAVSKRLRQLRLIEPPESFSRLTDKQQKFVLAKAEGKTNLEAAKASHDVSNSDSAKSLGCHLMRDPDINQALADVLAQEGLGRRRRIQRLKCVINCRDLSVAHRGLETAFRLAGEFVTEKPTMIIDYREYVIQMEAAEKMARQRLQELENMKPSNETSEE